MNMKRTPQVFGLCKGALMVAFAIVIIFSTATAQVPLKEPADGVYAGIEVSSDGVRAVVLQSSIEGDLPSVRMVYSEVIHLPSSQIGGGSPAPQAIKAADQAVNRLLNRIRQEWRVPESQVYLIGACELRADENRPLLDAIRTSTGKTLTLLEEATDAELSISGTIPKRIQEGDGWIDTRNSSILIQLGLFHTRLGYQMLKYLPPSPPGYNIVGTMIPSNLIGLRAALHEQFERAPSLQTRKNIYLSGDLAWAIVTLLYPGDSRNFVPLDAALISQFAKRVSVDPKGVSNPDLSKIKDSARRQLAEREVGWVRDAFTERQLIAAAVRLKLVAEEFNFQEKRVWYARHGDLARLMIYVRVQAEK